MFKGLTEKIGRPAFLAVAGMRHIPREPFGRQGAAEWCFAERDDDLLTTPDKLSRFVKWCITYI
jgi:hypothetical protein